MKRVLLLYWGRLADKVALHWLKKKKKMAVYTYTPQAGDDEVIDNAWEDAMHLGVESSYFGEMKEKYFEYMITRAIRGRIRARNGDYLINALLRPVIAREMSVIAEENRCSSVAFAADPYSLDHLRYSNLFSSISPSLNVISPQNDWPMRKFEDLLAYARENKIPVSEHSTKGYTVEQNLWGARIKCGIIEDLWEDVPEDVCHTVKSPELAPDVPAYIDLTFREGLPVKLDDTEYSGYDIIPELNSIGATHCVGRSDLIGEELLGLKTRIIQEAPAAHIIMTAHKVLEDITLPTEVVDVERMLSNKLAKIVLEGEWFTDFREAICTFFDRMQVHVNGTIRLKLFKGGLTVMRRKADEALYDRTLVTSDNEGAFPVHDMEKFINVVKTTKKVEKDLSTKKL